MRLTDQHISNTSQRGVTDGDAVSARGEIYRAYTEWRREHRRHKKQYPISKALRIERIAIQRLETKLDWVNQMEILSNDTS